jgi:hypothetical protein
VSTRRRLLRPLVLIPAFVALSLAAGIGYAAYEQVSTSAIEANTELLDSLPTYPDAREADRRSDTAPAGSLPVPKGVVTTVLYLPPQGATQEDVLDFYVTRLRGWRARTSSVQGAYKAEFTRVDDCVALMTYGMAPGHAGARTFAIAAEAGEGGC